MQNVLDDCAANENVSCILLTGADKAFCAGQDIAELTGDNPIGIEVILVEHLNPVISKIRNSQKPIVCADTAVAAGDHEN